MLYAVDVTKMATGKRLRLDWRKTRHPYYITVFIGPGRTCDISCG
jgi:hypothetical protein